MNTTKLPVTIGLLFFALLAYFLFEFYATEKVEPDLKSQYLKAGDFELEYKGSPFSLSQLRGQPVLVYFGYTFCPDVCPVGLSVISRLLKRREAYRDVKALFITLDPERDSQVRLAEYTSFFHENILGLRGSIEQISAVSQAYGTFFRKSSSQVEANSKAGADAALGDNYTVDHSAYFYLVDAQGELLRVFDHDTKQEQIAEVLDKLL
jgi:protein SCO1